MVDQGKDFCNSFMRKWLDDIDFLMYLTRNKGKSEVAQSLIEWLKGKIY